MHHSSARLLRTGSFGTRSPGGLRWPRNIRYFLTLRCVRERLSAASSFPSRSGIELREMDGGGARCAVLPRIQGHRGAVALLLRNWSADFSSREGYLLDPVGKDPRTFGWEAGRPVRAFGPDNSLWPGPRQVGDAAKHCQTTPVAGPSEGEIVPLVSYRASVELVLRWERSDQVVFGLRWEQRRGPEVMLLAARIVSGVALDSPPNRLSRVLRRHGLQSLCAAPA